MKKLLIVMLSLLIVLVLAGCGKKDTFDPNAKQEGSMTHAEFDAANKGDAVVIEGYVQAVQSYYNGASMYITDGDGGYFVYQEGDFDPTISEEDYAKLVSSTDFKEGWVGLANGTHVVVSGEKTEWSGEVEVHAGLNNPCVVTIVDDQKWTATATDLTGKFSDDLASYNNDLVKFSDLEVVAQADGTSAFYYKWDNSGKSGENKDLYYNLTDGTTTYTFVVESYLCYEGSDVYTAVTNLKVGDKVDVEGFLYWYEAPQLHTTSILVK